MCKKLSKEEFIEKCINIHGNTYDYSKVEYINSDTKVKIICKKHGEFLQIPYHHLAGHKCKKCSSVIISQKKLLSNDEFITMAKNIHGNTYSYDKTIYKSSKKKITITCKIHGDFQQTPDAHIHGSGCQKCSIDRNKENLTTSNDEFIKKANEVHKNIYSYYKSFYKHSKEKVTVTCKKHGDFEITPSNHINNKRGCPYCHRKSNGEILISKLLTINNIPFTHQKWYNDLRNIETGRPYRFDFYVIDKNTIIEFDGIHHRIPVEIWGGKKGLEKVQLSDEIKNEYCKNNNITIIRIDSYEKIESILKDNNII